MVICTMGPLHQPEGWNSKRCELGILSRPPIRPLTFHHPRWNERRIESSLLQSPLALANVLGFSDVGKVLALRQVDEVDLYVRVDDRIHLIEVKGLKGPGQSPYRRWGEALCQIAEYWSSRRAWLAADATSVNLWALCPIYWNKTGPQVPEGWQSTIAGCRQAHPNLPPLGLMFYSLFQDAGQQLMLIWRADEAIPPVNLDSRAAIQPLAAVGARGDDGARRG